MCSMATGRTSEIFKEGWDRANPWSWLQPTRAAEAMNRVWSPTCEREERALVCLRELAEEALSWVSASLHAQQRTYPSDMPETCLYLEMLRLFVLGYLIPVIPISPMCVSCYLVALAIHLKIEIWLVSHIRACFFFYLFISPDYQHIFLNWYMQPPAVMLCLSSIASRGLKYAYAARFAGLCICLGKR